MYIMDTNPDTNPIEYTINGNIIYFSSQFNKCLLPYYNILTTITHIIFNDYGVNASRFNTRFVTLKNPILISFGSFFNQPFVLTKYILYLGFGKHFNQPIVLSKNIKKLRIGHEHNGGIFDQPINLSKNLIILCINATFNQSLILTKKIKVFALKYSFFNNPISLPKHLVRVAFYRYFRQPIILNKTINVLELETYLHTCILDSTSNLKITHGIHNDFIRDNLPNSISEVREYCYYAKHHLKPLNNIPNCLVKKTTHGIWDRQYVTLVKEK